jgi:tetratricopeptide (TPR) repeat protein
VPDIGGTLEHARALAAKAEDEAAKQAYIEILRQDPTHLAALNELGTLAFSGGFRSAARTAYLQAVQHHPGDKIVRVNLANLLREEQDFAAARLHYEAALAVDPDFPEAHQGMALVLNELGLEGADRHWHRGFSGHAIVRKPYRGTGPGVPLILLVSARGGNIPTQLWISDRQFAITAIYAEFHDPGLPLPPHALIVNAVGDADLCGAALLRAEQIAARSAAPVINPPARVRLTGRAENARRLAAIEGVIAPAIRTLSPAAILADGDLAFPILLRRPGFHTGRHFIRVDSRDALAPAIAALAALAAEELLAIQYLDARGPDGMARKYRVMFIDGVAYPLHLAISADWKVHYFSADMARDAGHREEERRFLEDMPSVLGTRAMAALERIRGILGLEYGGIDFALSPDGSVLLFEANATMVVFPPNPDPIWDYRRGAIDLVLEAATRMLLRHADHAVIAAEKPG